MIVGTVSESELLRRGLAAYDDGWRDCLRSLSYVPEDKRQAVIDHLLAKLGTA